MFYIGSHWNKEDDTYICSSNRMRKAYRRRPNDFKRRVIERYENIAYKSLLEREDQWLQLIPDEQLGKRYYNLRKRAAHWASSPNDKLTIGEKISQTKIARGVHAGENHWNYGSHLSEKTKAKQSAKLKGRQVWNKGLKGSMKAWNKGLSKDDPRLENCIKHLKKFSKGHIPWNKGIRKQVT
jgi:hypothetical protein